MTTRCIAQYSTLKDLSVGCRLTRMATLNCGRPRPNRDSSSNHWPSRLSMLFCCPRCKREEEIIADSKPHCKKCHIEMIPPSDYSQIWMSPYTAIVRMRTLSERCGTD